MSISYIGKFLGILIVGLFEALESSIVKELVKKSS